jgi:signal transduction histidine kinase
LSLRLRIYVTSVVLAAVLLMALTAAPAVPERWVTYLLWTAVCVVAELLWVPTLSREATVSMASAANMATLALWGTWPAMVAVGVSTLIANWVFQHKPWVRAVFNFGQAVVTIWVAGMVMRMLGHPAEGLGPSGRLSFGEVGAVTLTAHMFVGFLVYLLVNRVLVSAAVSWSSDRPYLRVLREDWFHRERLLNDMALFFLSPLAVISFGSVGYVGLLLFYMPLQMTFETYKRFLELQAAQQQMVHTERMAAKGEMASEIGHELRNQLVAISGRAQMLIRDAQRQTWENVDRHAAIILDQSKRMKVMADGLMQFSRAEIKVEPVDLNALVGDSVELVRAQNRFDGVEWDLRLASPVPTLRMDPGQIQQVLINLFMNAADAMNEKQSPRKVISVVTELDERQRQLRLRVEDTGTGIPAEVMNRIFEPHFTTKPTGNGFGLATSYRILQNHGGRISASNLPVGGACFSLNLPVDGPGSWN